MKHLRNIFAGISLLAFIMLLPACNTSPAGSDGDGPIRIGAITSLSGALQTYGEDFQRGFLLGMEYFTNGTNTVAGRPIEIIWEDTATTPEVALERTMRLLEVEQVDIITGYASSADALASMALFEEFETVAVIEPAASDLIITYGNWNEFIFRTGRTSGQDALAMASIIANNNPQGGVTVAAFGPDSAFGRSMVDPFVAASQNLGLNVIATEFPPVDTTDFTPFLLRIRQLAPDYLYVIWAGANNPWLQLLELDMQGAGITVVTGAPEMAALQGMLELGDVGGIGFCVYYPDLPQNIHLNDWMVRRHIEDHGMRPDLFTSGGFAAASAIITALEHTDGNTDARVLIDTMRGMEFDTPTGMRHFRPEDHQAMQDLFEVRLTRGETHLVPVYVRTIPAHEITPPIMNRPQ